MPVFRPQFPDYWDMLPSGAVYATASSNVFLHGNTEFAGNYAGDDGGKPNTIRADISVISPLVEQ